MIPTFLEIIQKQHFSSMDDLCISEKKSFTNNCANMVVVKLNIIFLQGISNVLLRLFVICIEFLVSCSI